MKEDYIVFQIDGEDWEQESIPLTLEEARNFLKSMQKSYPDSCHVIMTKIE